MKRSSKYHFQRVVYWLLLPGLCVVVLLISQVAEAQIGRDQAARALRNNAPRVLTRRVAPPGPAREIVVYAAGSGIVVAASDGRRVGTAMISFQGSDPRVMILGTNFGPGLIRLRIVSRHTRVTSMGMRGGRQNLPTGDFTESIEILLGMHEGQLRVLRSLTVRGEVVVRARYEWDSHTQMLSEVVQRRNRRGRERCHQPPERTTRLRWTGTEFVEVSREGYASPCGGSPLEDLDLL